MIGVGLRHPGRARAALLLLSGALLASACGQASDSVSASQKVITGATVAPAVSAPERQTTSPGAKVSTALTNSPTVVPSQLAAPPTSGGSGEAPVTTDTGVVVIQTLPTVVPTSAPDLVTTAPTTPSDSTPASAPTTPSAPPAAAAPVTVTSLACGNHADGDWMVFRLNNSGVVPSAAYGPSPIAVSGDNTVVVTLAPAVDATSGALIASGCRFATEAKLVATGNGWVTWAIGVMGQPRLSLGIPGPAGDGSFAFVLKLLA